MQTKRWLPIIAVCGLAWTGVTARAAVTQDTFLVRNTGDLVDLCSAAQTDPLYTAAVNFCHGFTVGVFRTLQKVDMADQAQHLFCLPNPLPTRNNAIAAFVQWAKAEPSRMAQPADDQIAAFMSQQYPCSRGR